MVRRQSPASVLTVALGALMALSGCMEPAEEAPRGLRVAALSGGARIVFDLDERPFPNIPFPNDLATRPDPTSPTGLRVNISERGASDAEERVRRAVNQYSGWGMFSSITVSFTEPLDVHDLARRHQEPVPDLSDDAIYLVDIDPSSPEYGAFQLLDLGRGNFPVTMLQPERYLDNDPRVMGTNLLFESVEEIDLNGNGVLDPIEDTDDDGVWDRPNTLDRGADPLAFGQMMEYYERETNTLILRSVKPLRGGTRYAVVLTGALKDAKGRPIDSPFNTINHTRQTEVLRPLKEILPAKFPERFNKDLAGVRFAWAFTTHNPTHELEAVRAGLYGHGPFAKLAEAYPPDLKLLHNVKAEGKPEPMTFDINSLGAILQPLLTQFAGANAGDALVDSMKNVDYLVSGSYMSPNLVFDTDGLADPISAAEPAEEGGVFDLDSLNPQNDDELFDLNPGTGRIKHKPGEVTFTCAVPKPTATQQAPFPTIIYTHAISSTRLEMLAFIGSMAKFGFATCTIDNMGHGVAIPDEYARLVDLIAPGQGVPYLRTLVTHHRARDLNNDGVTDSGLDYLTADTLHTRDMIRQTTIDQLQLVRILRSFDGKRRFPKTLDKDDPYIRARLPGVSPWDQDGDGEPELVGDFNADGVIDFGGDQTFVAWGTSQGAIQTSLLAAIEPTVRAAAMNAGGGGLGDIIGRTSISQVRMGAVARIMGPILSGTRASDGSMVFSWMIPDLDNGLRVPFARVEGIEDGDKVVLHNPRHEANPYTPEDERVKHALVRNGRVRVSIAADAKLASYRRAATGLDPKFNMYEEGMGCVTSKTCGDVSCDDDNYCTPQGTCAPISQCYTAFDPSQVDDEETRRHIIEDATRFGDALYIEIFDAEGNLKRRIDTFENHVLFQNILYPAGSPLAALIEGWGLTRQTPAFRRLVGLAGFLLEPADPTVWATHYVDRPLSFPYEATHKLGATNTLVVGTLGDQTVPISAGLSLARAAGSLDVWSEDPRYGMTANQFLVQSYVYEGIYWLDRNPDHPQSIFDPDDLDEGAFRSTIIPGDDPNLDATEPLRAVQESPYWSGKLGLRLPYLRVRGEHTFNAPNPDLAFDIHTYMTNQVGWYLATGSRQLVDDVCFEADLAMSQCSFYDPATFKIQLPE